MGGPVWKLVVIRESLLGGSSPAFRLRWRVSTSVPMEGGFWHEHVARPPFPQAFTVQGIDRPVEWGPRDRECAVGPNMGAEIREEVFGRGVGGVGVGSFNTRMLGD